jgi:hypothetical protein
MRTVVEARVSEKSSVQRVFRQHCLDARVERVRRLSETAIEEGAVLEAPYLSAGSTT